MAQITRPNSPNAAIIEDSNDPDNPDNPDNPDTPDNPDHPDNPALAGAGPPNAMGDATTVRGNHVVMTATDCRPAQASRA